MMGAELREPAQLARSVLSDETYAVIRDLVLDHDIPAGARVNIDSLSARLGVSPTPVREALARLESDGLVVKTPLRGYSTTPLLTSREFVELTQFRVLIEQWTSERAATGADAGVRRDLRAELASARSRHDAGEWGPEAFRALTEHDARFHGRIAEAAGNELIAQAFERTHFHLHFLRLYLASRSPEIADRKTAAKLSVRLLDCDQMSKLSMLDEHTAIAEAVAAGDSELAPRLMREHIERSSKLFLPIAKLLSPSR